MYSSIKRYMEYALEEYGQLAIAFGGKEKALKKVIFDQTDVNANTFEHIREAMIFNGDILESNEKKNYCIASIKAGFMNATRALVVAEKTQSKILFAAYAKEGLIKRKLSQKAICKIKKYL